MPKKATYLHEQIALLRSRGMVITNEQKAEEILLDVGYYRLGFYAYPFEINPQQQPRDHLLPRHVPARDARFGLCENASGMGRENTERVRDKSGRRTGDRGCGS